MADVVCPECGEKLSYDDAYAGKAMTCSGCGKPFLMPDLDIPTAKPAVAESVPRAALYAAPGYFPVVGWLSLGLGAAAAAASFYLGGQGEYSFDSEAALVSAALNPLLWIGGVLGVFFLHRAYNMSGTACRCPHCNRIGTKPAEYRETWKPGCEVTCPRCKRRFLHP